MHMQPQLPQLPALPTTPVAHPPHQPIAAQHIQQPLVGLTKPQTKLQTPTQTPGSAKLQQTPQTSQHRPQQPPQHYQQQQKQQPSQPQQQELQNTSSIGNNSNAKVDNTANDLNDIQRVRSKMPQWSVSDVVKFIEQHDDIKQYSSKFAEDEMDGKGLLWFIDQHLNFQVLTSMFNIKYGPAMKIEATLSRYKLAE